MPFFHKLSLDISKRLKKSLFGALLLCLTPTLYAFSAYTNDELDQLEREFVQQINQSNQVVREPLAENYINHIGNLLAQHADGVSPTFFIVDAAEINAFAGPGGYIGVNSALIIATKTESELAAVMAHEMAHVRQHHLYRMIEHQKQMRVPMLASMLAAIALGVVNPALGSGALMGALTNFSQDNINFVRSNEKEADSIGIDMLIKAKFDPRDMANFFKKMQANSRYSYTDNIPAILRSHPLDDDRIAEAENRSLHLKNPPMPDPLEYHLFKAFIQVTVSSGDHATTEALLSQCHEDIHKEVCSYTQALILLRDHHDKEAESYLAPLRAHDPTNFYYAISMANAQINDGKTEDALNLLAEFNANFPNNYALTVHYADLLVAANKFEKAVSVLLKASRVFPKSIPVCEQLANAEAKNHQTGYAYFTLAQCHVLRGEMRDAVRTLTLAKTFVHKDNVLKMRIEAKLDEVKSMVGP